MAELLCYVWLYFRLPKINREIEIRQRLGAGGVATSSTSSQLTANSNYES